MELSEIINRLKLLLSGNICISYNPDNLKEVWGYYLYANKEKLLIWTKYGKTVFDDYLIKTDRSLFELGKIFTQIKYPQDCDIEVLKSEYFYLLNGNILKKIFWQKK